ncbi:uncharacterized protein LOC132643774 [Lycium barbarum]|uniref:uncharacterized protein LOC132643774 n=1 Tax=Lycium barbarum TaxID=112863 RepID=UPI00293E12F9|nr:uncharacterized protein LOC132643774 [Lycium barbarum]
MKWLWRYSNEDQTLWKKVIKEKYGEEDAWKTKIINTVYGVSVWRTIRNFWMIFSINIRFKVWDGQQISFWDDNWSGNGSLRHLYPDVYILNQQQRVNINEVWNNQGWDLSFRRPLNDWEMDRFIAFLNNLNLFNGVSPEQDRLWLTTQLWDIFLAKIGLSWAMLIHTLDMLYSWSRRRGTKSSKKEMEYDSRLHMVDYPEGKELEMLEMF